MEKPHSFSPSVAKEVGINAATILYNIEFWIEKNKANNKHLYDGCYWTYNSVKAFESLFPYLTTKQIRTALDKLESSGYIKTGNYNKSNYDRTKWYSLGERLLPSGQSDLPVKANRNAQKGEPIPDINTDGKPDGICDQPAESPSKIAAMDVLDIFHQTIDEQKPNWAKCRTFDQQRKRLALKAIDTVRQRAIELGDSPLDYLAKLLPAMAADPFYGGWQQTEKHPNGYRSSIDQILSPKQIRNAIDKLS